jgi:mycofactocin system creatininase family protein
VIPVAAIEQHGHHLPVVTDSLLLGEIVARVSARMAERVLFAPLQWLGNSHHHLDFAGTVSASPRVYLDLLNDTVECFLTHGFRRIVLVNGHGGNRDALVAAATVLRGEGRDVAWWNCSVSGADAHAGHTETALLLHLSPEVVRMRAVAPGNTEPLADLMPRMRDGGVVAVSASGVLGDPTTATPAAGERIFAAMVSDCAAQVRRWQPGANGLLA